jgi:hypothetical protein
MGSARVVGAVPWVPDDPDDGVVPGDDPQPAATSAKTISSRRTIPPEMAAG